MAENRLFLGVENSATGRAWRDRLDERGARFPCHRAAPRNCRKSWRASSPAAMSRPTASRVSRSERQALDAGPACSDRHGGGGEPDRGRDRAWRERGDLWRLRRRRRDLIGAARTLSAATPPRADHPYSRPPVRRLRAERARRSAGSPTAAQRSWSDVDCGSTSIEPLAAKRNARSSISSSSITIRPTRRCRRPWPSSIRTGLTTCPGSAILRRSVSFS